MAKKTKKEQMIELASFAHSARNKKDLDEAALSMLWVMVEGTRYEKDVEIAFDMREKYCEMERMGRFIN